MATLVEASLKFSISCVKFTIAMNFLLKKFPNISKVVAFSCANHQRRFLNLQEHVSYSILNEHGIVTPRFGEAKSAEDAERVARDLLTKNLIVKAQVITGGRKLGKFTNGFNGGVHSAIWFVIHL